MNIVLHPRAAPGDRIRVWIGAFQATAIPTLTWSLDGVVKVPTALRAISSVRSNTMLPQNPPPGNQPRAFTGVYEFTGLTPNTLHTISVKADGADPRSIEIRTLADRVPASLDGSFNVLLVSCFHQHEDPAGLAGIIVSQLKATSKPHLTLLMGDQVYLDLPTLQNFKDDVVWLARKFEEDYTANWQGSPGYFQVLASAPSISIPDDHEFWNNYPHASPVVGNTLTSDGRDRWRQAALALYEGFQLPYPSKLGEPSVIDIEPLSFFLPDMRSLRDPGRRFTMNDAAHQKMEAWVSDVIARKRFGILVTGQSLFTEPAKELSGSVGDFEMPNYGDYGRVMSQLRRLADAGLPALCLTGDVHWGRVTRSVDVRTQRTALYEIISSPSSLVTTVGVDQFHTVIGAISGLFGKRDPWPRHSDAAVPPDFLASGVQGMEGRFRSSKIYSQKGNHVALLRFAQRGGGIDLRVSYWPISRDSTIGKPIELQPIQLNRM